MLTIMGIVVAINCAEPTVPLVDFRNKYYGADVKGETFESRMIRHLESMDGYLDYLAARVNKCHKLK